jgi:Uma2 family endonuclease
MTQRLGERPGTSHRRRQATSLLSVPSAVRLRVSPAGFWRLCLANRDLRLERTANGGVIIMSPAGSEIGRRNAILTVRLGNWAMADGTGEAFDSSAGFTLPNGAIRSPDASWLTSNRWKSLTTSQREECFVPLCPDFVAELRSRSDRLPTLRKKMQEYLEQGARLGWLIDPEAGEVEIYRPGRPVEVVRRPETLSGEDVLPMFVLDLQGILFD